MSLDLFIHELRRPEGASDEEALKAYHERPYEMWVQTWSDWDIRSEIWTKGKKIDMTYAIFKGKDVPRLGLEPEVEYVCYASW